jgi:hypothetical protein
VAEAEGEPEATESALVDAEPTEVVEAAEEIAAAAKELEEANAELTAASEELEAAEVELDEAEEQLAAAAEEAEAVAAVTEPEEAVVVVAVAEETATEETAGEVSEGEVLVAAFAPLRPGEVSRPAIAIWQPDTVSAFRNQVRDIQAEFVDDPEGAVAQARTLVTNAVHTLADALLANQLGDIDPLAQPDTESLRVALRRYREFLDRVLAL